MADFGGIGFCCCFTPYWGYAKHYDGFDVDSGAIEVFRDDDPDLYLQFVNNGTNFAWSVNGSLTFGTPSKRSMRRIDPDDPVLIYDEIPHEDYKTGELSIDAIPWAMLSDGSVIEAGTTHARLVDNTGAAVWTVDYSSPTTRTVSCLAVDEANGYVYIGFSSGVASEFRAQCWDLSDGSPIWGSTAFPFGIDLVQPYGVVVDGSDAVWCGHTNNTIPSIDAPDIWRTDNTGTVTDHARYSSGTGIANNPSAAGSIVAGRTSGFFLRVGFTQPLVAVQSDLVTEDWRIATSGSNVLSVNAMVPDGDTVVFGGRWGANTSDVGLFKAASGSEVWRRCFGRGGDGVTGTKYAPVRMWLNPSGGYFANILAAGAVNPKFWDFGGEPPW